jgi:hypothetical protein
MEPLVTIPMSSVVLPDNAAGYAAVTEAAFQESALSDADRAVAAASSSTGDANYPLRERLVAYLNVLGVKDAAQANVIAVDALSRARRKVAPGLNEELFRRALEDIQRCLDLALTRSLGLGLTSDTRAVSGARAALLMGQGVSTDVLLDSAALPPLDIEALRSALPQATPPESPLPMHEQPFSFFFGPSSLSKSK